MEATKQNDPLFTKLKAEFQLEQGAENRYFVIVEKRKFDASTGTRLSKPTIQSFGKKEFDGYVRRHLESNGYTLEILHNPHAWEKQEKVRRIEEKAALQQIEDEKRKQAIEEAVKEQVKQELAKLQGVKEAAKGTTEKANPSNEDKGNKGSDTEPGKKPRGGAANK